MKRKRFYNNKNRNQKWTEPETGRPISFADKYAEGDAGGNKYVKSKAERTSDLAKSEQKTKRLITAGVVFCCVLLVIFGFIGADIHMIRSNVPVSKLNSAEEQNGNDTMENLNLVFSGVVVPSISLDGSVMMSAVISDAQKNGKTAVVFDAKRSDGTIGYASALSAVETYSVMNSQGKKPVESVKQLTENDLLPIARIYTYLDNAVPSKSSDMALKNGKKLYKDDDGNTYLNPDSEIAYGYIKDIVAELNSYGITVFVLDGCTVGKKDLYGELVKKLNSDIDGNLKFLEAVNVSIDGMDAESGDINGDGIKHDISNFPKLKKNQVYVITTNLEFDKYSQLLVKNNITTYIINQE